MAFYVGRVHVDAQVYVVCACVSACLFICMSVCVSKWNMRLCVYVCGCVWMCACLFAGGFVCVCILCLQVMYVRRKGYRNVSVLSVGVRVVTICVTGLSICVCVVSVCVCFLCYVLSLCVFVLGSAFVSVRVCLCACGLLVSERLSGSLLCVCMYVCVCSGECLCVCSRVFRIYCLVWLHVQ